MGPSIEPRGTKSDVNLLYKSDSSFPLNQHPSLLEGQLYPHLQSVREVDQRRRGWRLGIRRCKNDVLGVQDEVNFTVACLAVDGS